MMLTCCEEPRVTNPTKGGDELGIVNLTEALGEKATPPKKTPQLIKEKPLTSVDIIFCLFPLPLSDSVMKQ